MTPIVVEGESANTPRTRSFQRGAVAPHSVAGTARPRIRRDRAAWSNSSPCGVPRTVRKATTCSPGDKAGILDQIDPSTACRASRPASAVEYEPGCDRGDRLGGPGDVGDGAWRRRTRPERGSVLVARAHNHLATSGEPSRSPHRRAWTGDLVRRTDPGQLVRLDARGGEHRLGPRTRRTS